MLCAVAGSKNAIIMESNNNLFMVFDNFKELYCADKAHPQIEGKPAYV
jgi:hypothetical protein